MFYILSAFTLCSQYDGGLSSKLEIKQYAVRRFLRIAPLFYLMFPIWVAVMWKQFHIDPSIIRTLANITFLFNFIPGMEESIVWAGWSIGVEVIFYSVLPLLLKLTTNLRRSLYVLAASIAVALLFQAVVTPINPGFARFSILSQLPYFIAGIVSYRVYERGASGWWLAGAAVAIWAAIAVLNLGHTTIIGVDIDQYMISCAFPFILLFSISRPRILSVFYFDFLGKIGYSIYLLHPLFIFHIGAAVYQFKNVYGEVPAIIFGFAVAMALTVSGSAITYRLIERPFMRLGHLRRRAVAE